MNTDEQERRAQAIDAARDARDLAESQGQDSIQTFLAAWRAAAALVDENTAGIIAARMLSMLDENNSPTRRP